MSPIFDLHDEAQRAEGLDAAAQAVGEGKLVILPTDTVYGVGTDPFNSAGVAGLLAAKGRGREMPPPVLVPNAQTVEGLAMSVPSYARRLIEAFWPGGLTLILRAQPSLMWDLGDTNGTVGLRMPDDDFALELLGRTGPMAVSSANQTGKPTATTVTEAGFAFGPSVEVYLDGGERTGNTPSTILDCTKADPVLLRTGAISVEQLREVLGPIDLLDATGAPLSEHPDPNYIDETAAQAAADDAAQHANSGVDFDKRTYVEPDVEDDEESGMSLADIDPDAHLDSPTQAIPIAQPGQHQGQGVGAEPPFERESALEVELPKPPKPSND